MLKFDIAVKKVDTSEAQAVQCARRIVGLEQGQPVPRVLVAEDDEASRSLLAGLLKSWGLLDVREAVDGQEAVRMCEEWQPRLIWMDIQMPAMGGFEATQRIKSTTDKQSPVIIALTAHAFEEQRAEILAAGCDDFVRKPFRESEIGNAMAKHLGMRFVYEDTPNQAISTEQIVSLASSDLAVLPKEWITKLRSVAIRAHPGSIVAVIEEIEPDQAQMAASLKTLVAKFQYDRILSLVDEALAL